MLDVAPNVFPSFIPGSSKQMDLGTFFPKTNGLPSLWDRNFARKRSVEKATGPADFCCLGDENIARKDVGEALDKEFRRF